MNEKKFSLKSRIRSFRYAFRGIILLVRNEHNARIHLAAAITAITAGALLRITPLEWAAVTLCITAVLAAEALNSAVESLADFISPGQSPLIGKAKDLAAAAVLITAIGAAIIGTIIFLPRIANLIL